MQYIDPPLDEGRPPPPPPPPGVADFLAEVWRDMRAQPGTSSLLR
jgi:hypothetical protein